MSTFATEPLTQDDLAFYRDNGYFIARGLISREEADEIRKTFSDYAANGPVEGLSDMVAYAEVNNKRVRTKLPADDPLAFYPRMMHPHRHPDKPVGPIALKYLLDERIGAVLAQLMEDEPIAAQTMFYFKPPLARGQDLHQDNFYLRVKPGTCMAAWMAVDPADEENGGMMVVPGTQNMDVACPEEGKDPSKFFTSEHVPVPAGHHTETCRLQPGDVLFFNGSIIHGSYPNTSKTRFRRSLIMHYVPASCIEVSRGYHPLLRFDGTVVSKEGATGGGPCGTQNLVTAPH